MAYKNPNNIPEDNEQDEEAVFMDKYRLSFNILEQEGILIFQYNELIRSKTIGYFDKDTIQKSSSFLDCWATLKGLYDFLEFGKLPSIKNKDEVAKLKVLMEKYELTDKITLDDLKQAYTLIRSFIALCGYHEDKFKDKKGSLDDEED
jgi:hypothetical protein